MNGKILKVASNDLYGNADDRQVAVFAVFNHKKYMNKYIIFAFESATGEKKLCLGSVHLKDNSLVIFEIRKDEVKYVMDFVSQYVQGTVNSKEYEIISINKISKAELVSYNQEDYDKLSELDKISIKRVAANSEEESYKSPVFLYGLLVFLIFALIGITYVYFNPEILEVELKQLSCTMENGFDEKTELNYSSEILAKFNRDDKLKMLKQVDIYKFDDKDTYYDFKDNNKESIYFKAEGGYKYNDNDLELRIIYDDKLIIENYKEVLNYLKNGGYSCVEGTFYE